MRSREWYPRLAEGVCFRRVFLLLPLIVGLPIVTASYDETQPRTADIAASSASFTFEKNSGQWHGENLYVAHLGNLRLRLARQHFTYETVTASGEISLVRFNLLDSKPGVTITGEYVDPMRTHYYVNNLRFSGAHFRSVRYKNIYDDIDLLFFENDGKIEYDFIVHPGGDPADIKLEVATNTGVTINNSELTIGTETETFFRFQQPLTYQLDERGERHTIESAFHFLSDRILTFAVDRHYNPAIPLVIDPVLENSAIFLRGALSDAAASIAVDQDENVYIAGSSFSPYFDTFPSSQSASNTGRNLFVAKFGAESVSPEFVTFISGSYDDIARNIQLDSQGNIIVAGETLSPDLPITSAQSFARGNWDAFVIRLNGQGNLTDSIYVGGAADDYAHAMAVTPDDEIIIAGETWSSDFTTTANAFTSDCSEANICAKANGFLSRLSASGNLVYSTLVGGEQEDSVHAIAVDQNNVVHLGGETASDDFPLRFPIQQNPGGNTDGFVMQIDMRKAGQQALVFSSFIGGRNHDTVTAVGVLKNGNTIIAGNTNSDDFPVSSEAAVTKCNLGKTACDSPLAASDIFVTAIDHSFHDRFAYSSFYGGSGEDTVAAIAVTGNEIFVTGNTFSGDFPSTDTALNTDCQTPSGCDIKQDMYLAKFDTTRSRRGSVRYSSYLGGNDADYAGGIHVSTNGDVYLAGETSSRSLIQGMAGTAAKAEDVFILKISAPRAGVLSRLPGDPPPARRSAMSPEFILLFLFIYLIKKIKRPNLIFTRSRHKVDT